MEKVSSTAGVSTRKIYAYRVSRFLKVFGHPDLKANVDAATADLIAKKRTIEDLERPYQECIADRQLAEANLEDTARVVRRLLAARGPRAELEPPSTDIFPDGLDGYTKLKLESVVFEFGRLVDRIGTHLPKEDPVRVEQVPALKDGLDEWEAADAAVDAALGDLEDAREAQDRAVAAWDRAIEGAYGELLSRVGKAKAERCFPKGRGRPKPAPAPTEVAAAPAEATADEPTE